MVMAGMTAAFGEEDGDGDAVMPMDRIETDRWTHRDTTDRPERLYAARV